MVSRAARVLAQARKAGLRIATAESCTGGMIAAALTDIPGSSDVFERGFVTYSNAAKAELLGVDAEVIAENGAVSEAVAAAMARGAVAQSHADLAVSVTGVAGPGGTAAKPEGMVCFAFSDGLEIMAETKHFGAIGRAAVRQASTDHALNILAEFLGDIG